MATIALRHIFCIANNNDVISSRGEGSICWGLLNSSESSQEGLAVRKRVKLSLELVSDNFSLVRGKANIINTYLKKSHVKKHDGYKTASKSKLYVILIWIRSIKFHNQFTKVFMDLVRKYRRDCSNLCVFVPAPDAVTFCIPFPHTLLRVIIKLWPH